MSKARNKLRMGITLGDYNGTGPELVIKAFSDTRLKELITPILYGSSRVLNFYRKQLGGEKFSYHVIQQPDQAQPKKLSIIECMGEVEQIEPGLPSPAAGKAAVMALEAATQHLKAGEIDALVTLPFDKSTVQSETFKFPGHTEYLAEAFGVPDNLMLMVSEDMRMAVATGHLPLKDVSRSLSISRIHHKLKLLNESLMQDFSIRKPKIAVLGVNPHAGDRGLLGNEEQDIIMKAIQQAEKDKITVFGPFSADGFFGSGQYSRYDGILAMYHDQGLIPFKLLAGLHGTNFTAGLPVIRTSPDHGTGYELAGKDIASPDSFIHAIFTATDIYRNRTENQELKEGALVPGKVKERFKESREDKSED